MTGRQQVGFAQVLTVTQLGTKTGTIKTRKPVVVVHFDGTSKRVTPRDGVVKIKVTNNPVFVRSGSATAGVTK